LCHDAGRAVAWQINGVERWKVNVAIIGYGSIAVDHVRAIVALQGTLVGRDVRLYGVVGPKEEPTAAFAREYGISVATTDLDDLLGDANVDAVIVCSPSGVHAEQTERCLRAGKHVLCEIPLAFSLAETERLIALADEVDRRLMVCHTQRYIPALMEARRMIVEGEIHPHAIVSRYMFGRRQNINWRGRQRTWTDNLLWHHGGHAVDGALWLLGVAERDETVATVAQVALPGADLGIPMDLSLAMRTARDQLVTVAMSYHIHFSVHDYLIIGEERTLLFANGQLRDGEQVLVEADRTEPGEATSQIARQETEFFAAIREGREPAISGRSVRPAMAALQVAQDVFEGRVMEVGEEGGHPRLP
jgi:2-hydroxy-4-carboxymuconate semialdehyde hemiacetal dehydrogenase